MKIVPRDYQIEAQVAARDALSATGRALVVIASGLGKTITSALVWRGFRRGRGVFLVHSNEILEHAEQEYLKVFGLQTATAFLNGTNKDVANASIVFATFQSMRNCLEEYPKDYFSWMTVDETHHGAAKTYQEVIDYFDCAKLGITATPDRADLRDIREIFGQEVYDLPLELAIARGLLPEIEYHILTDVGFDYSALERLACEVIDDGRRISKEQINRRLFIPARDEKMAETIVSYSGQAIVFCSSITHATHFLRFLPDAATYHSDTFAREKEQRMEAFRQKELRYLLAIDCFNEGVDFPDVGIVVFGRSTASNTVFRQQLGRGLRPTKQKLIVLDFVGNLDRILMLKELSDKVKDLTVKEGKGDKPEREWKKGEVFQLGGGVFPSLSQTRR